MVSGWSPPAIARFSALFPYLLIVNHVLLFSLTVLAVRSDGLTLGGIGWVLSPEGGRKRRFWLPEEVLIGIGAGGILALIGWLVTGPLIMLSAQAFGDVGRLPIGFDATPAWLVAVTLFAGVTHETLYRGYALRVLGERNGVVWAVVISSIFFALFHWPQGLVTAVSIVPDGIFLCLLALWRRNLWAPLAAHAGFNLASLLLAF